MTRIYSMQVKTFKAAAAAAVCNKTASKRVRESSGKKRLKLVGCKVKSCWRFSFFLVLQSDEIRWERV